MKTYQTYIDIAWDARDMAIAMLESAEWDGRIISISQSGSGQSSSTYLEVAFEDEDGEYLDLDGDSHFKIRFSDHADRYGSDLTLRIDRIAEDVEDEDGDFLHMEVSEEKMTDIATRAVEAARAFFLKLQAN